MSDLKTSLIAFMRGQGRLDAVDEALVALINRRPEKADQIAAKALSLLPEEPDAHKLAAYSLQDRGFFEWAERGSYLLQLWVEPAARGHGVGRALIKAV